MRYSIPLVFSLICVLGCDSPQQDSPPPVSDGPIASLSVERERGLLAGAGLGYGRAAELNSYPGPRHVIELADSLGIDVAQRSRVEQIFHDMRDEAQALGAELVSVERELDAAFASGEATTSEVTRLTAEAGALEGRVRNAHLQAHLETRAVLTSEQIARYDHLRGHRSAHAVRQEGSQDTHEHRQPAEPQH